MLPDYGVAEALQQAVVPAWMDSWMVGDRNHVQGTSSYCHKLCYLGSSAMVSHKTIEVQCDNTGIVSATNKGSSKDKTAMHLIHCLWFFTALFQNRITTTHIPAGINNVAANMLSRSLLPQFWAAYPQAAQFPWYVPIPLLRLLSPEQLDCTLPSFLSLLQETISIIHKEAN